jgi:hypothetical protein
MNQSPLAFGAAFVVALGFSSAAFAECAIPTEANDWGATCNQGTSPFNPRDFAWSCFSDNNWENQCNAENNDAACDSLDQCIRAAAISVFGDE